MQTDARRRLILEVALQVLLERGYENAEVAEILQRVGGSKAAFQNYFLTKRELFDAVIEDFVGRTMNEHLLELGSKGPIQDVLAVFGGRYIRTRLSSDMVALHRIAESEGERTELGRLLYKHGISKGWNPVAEFLDSEMRLGTLPVSDASVAALHLKALLEAEVCERRMLGVTKATPVDRQLNALVGRATAAWLKAYGSVAPSTSHALVR